MNMTDFNPSMYTDLAAGSMNMLPTPMYNPFMGGMYYNTNLLGGAKLQPQLDSDKLQIMNEKSKKDKNIFYKALAGLSILAAIGFMRFGKTKIGTISSGSNFFKGLGKGFKTIGKAIAYPFVAVGKGIKNSSTKFGKWLKGLRKPKPPTPAGTPKRSWLSKLMFWKKTPAPPLPTP